MIVLFWILIAVLSGFFIFDYSRKESVKRNCKSFMLDKDLPHDVRAELFLEYIPKLLVVSKTDNLIGKICHLQRKSNPDEKWYACVVDDTLYIHCIFKVNTFENKLDCDWAFNILTGRQIY